MEIIQPNMGMIAKTMASMPKTIPAMPISCLQTLSFSSAGKYSGNGWPWGIGEKGRIAGLWRGFLENWVQLFAGPR